jgi:hypothetical protein
MFSVHWVQGNAGAPFFSLHNVRSNRTNNFAESNHGQLRFDFRATHPSIGEWIENVRSMTNVIDGEIDDILAGGRVEPPRRNPESIEADRAIAKAKRKFNREWDAHEGQESCGDCLKYLRRLGYLIGYGAH